jgi:LysM domain
MHQRTVQKRIAALLFLLAVVISGLNSADVVQAQCNLRSDWGTYIVVRGDTLYRIAQRFHTTISALAQGNCLSNANLIFVGQRLRVPGSGGSAPPPGGSPGQFTTGATFQQYENGFMVWRADNGEIRVYVGALAGDAVSIGGLTIFSAPQYSGLPSQQFTPPPGRVAPILGFGKVWGNVPAIRQSLGWAVSPEQSHTMTIQTSNRVVLGFTIPGNRWVNYYGGNRWTVGGLNRPPPAPQPTATSGPSDCFSPPYKPSSGITVGSSVVAVNAIAILNAPPPRGSQIGNLLAGDGGVVISGPYCFAVDNQHVRAWGVRVFQFAPNITEGYVLEYAVDNNGSDTTYLNLVLATNARIVTFTADPNPAEPGGAITVSWQVEGTQYALLTVLDTASNQPLGTVLELPASGSTTIQAPSSGTTEMLLRLEAANLTSEYPVRMYARLADSTLIVPIAIHQTSYTTQAIYQPFMNGFMIYRADDSAIFVFGLASVGIYPPTSLRNLPDNPYSDAPDGFYAPINDFGRIWGNDENTRKYMGWATTPVQSYQATVNELGEDSISISLPDGRTVFIDHQTWHW